VNLRNLQITNTDVGFEAAYSKNISILHNNLSSNDVDSIFVYYSSNTTIENNNVSDNDNEGIVLIESSNITINNNNVSSNFKVVSGWEFGIRLYSSSNNTITNNTVWNNDGGISLGLSSNNTIANNSFSLNTVYGIYLELSLYNRIFHNNIIDNTNQAYDDPSTNIWNETYPSGGNYWSDYSPTCIDNSDGVATPQTGGGGPDGICDNQLEIDVDSIDYYPLKYPFGTPDTTGPSITNPQPGESSTISEVMPTISADYSDPSGINTSSVRIEVDSVDVTSSPDTTITPSGVSYTPSVALSEEVHDVHIEVEDNLGNQATKTWSFTIDTTPDTTPPTISNEKPSDGSTISDSTPVISADFSDDTGINVTSVIVKVDGNDVTSSATITASSITYTPSSALSGGVHTVYVEVKDNSTNQNRANVTWSFTIDTSGTTDDGDFLSEYWWLILLVAIIVVALFVAFLLMKKKKKPESVETSKQAEDSQAVESQEQLPSEPPSDI
jgi:parallel beta-helix repeat protein